MTPRATVLGRRVVLGGALLAFACQQSGDAVFDNDHLAGSGGPATSSGGMQTAGGDGNSAASTTGSGSSDDAGESGNGAAGGSGEAGSVNEGGSAGIGSAGRGGAGGAAGKASGGTAGHAGTKPDPIPEPVTIMISEFEDTYVAYCEDESNYGDAATILIDAEPCTYQGLLRPSLDQIPAGALVSEAALTLQCVNGGSAVTAYHVDSAWTESTVTWADRPEVGTSITEIACAEMGSVTVNLTEVVKAWLGAEKAFGLYLRTEASDGIDFASSEANDASTRPVLSVTYVLPVR